MDGSARAETPSDSRASSIAPSASQQSIAGRGTTAPLDGHDDRAGNGAHFPGAVPQTYRPGCKHIRRMTSSELSLMLRHYALGVRWGKKIRRGIFRDLEEDEDSHGQLDFGANGWQNGFVHNRKRKVSTSKPPTSTKFGCLKRHLVFHTAPASSLVLGMSCHSTQAVSLSYLRIRRVSLLTRYCVGIARLYRSTPLDQSGSRLRHRDSFRASLLRRVQIQHFRPSI